MESKLILVVEDDPAVARSLTYALQDEGYDLLLAENGSKALELARLKHPHVILLDIRLPDINGFDICRTLRQEGYRMPILMLTAKDEITDRVLGLELGADDYIVKPYELKEVLSRIRAHIRRCYGELSGLNSGDVVRFADIELDPEKWQVLKSGKPIFLTPIEFRLLHYMTLRPDRICTRENLIEQVWGYSSDIGSDRSVDVHIRHLREKIEPDPADPKHIITVYGMGYKFVP